MSLILGLGVLLLLGASGLVVYFAGWGLPGWATAVTSWGGRAVLAAMALASLGGAMALAIRLSDRLVAGRALRRPGPKGDIAIAPRAVRQLAAGLLREELGLTGFKIRLVPAGEGVLLTVWLHLPSGEEAPRLAERVQELLSQEILAKTGLPVAEVNLVIRGTAGRPQGTDLPPTD